MDNEDWKVLSSFNNILCEPQTENKISDEIEWGVSFRKNRNQEKQLVLATTDSIVLPPTGPVKPTKKTKKRRKHKCKPVSPVVPERINRNTCTRKQYYDMLSRPRPNFHETNQKPIKHTAKSCSPRFEQLAMPTKQRALNTWQDYEDVLEPENILWLKNLLIRDESLAPKAAAQYFSKLDATKRKAQNEKKKKQKEQNVKKPKETKVISEIEGLAKDIVRYFANKIALNVKHRHMMITELIKEKLVDNNLVKPYKRNKHSVEGQTLHEILDQLSVWLETNVVSLIDEDLEEEEEGQAGSSQRSTTVSSYTSSDADILLSISEKLETASIVTIRGSLETVKEAEQIIEEIQDLTRVSTEEIQDLTGVSKEKIIVVEDEILIIDDGEKEDDVRADETKIAEETKIKEAAAEGIIEGIIDGIIEDEAIKESLKNVENKEDAETADVTTEVEVEEGEVETVEIETVEAEDLEIIEVKEAEAVKEIEDEAVEETDDQGALEAAEVGEDVEIKEKDANAIVGSILDGYIESIDMEAKESVPYDKTIRLVEEHSADATCCVAMKEWATWLAEVARNTHSWCQWIQRIINQIRFLGSVLKGEVKRGDGTPRILYEEEWKVFREKIKTDVITWIEYNLHVEDITKNIIVSFENKRVVCCPACLEEKIIGSENMAHEFSDKLMEAIQKTAYWRTWLDKVVVQTQILTELDMELSPAPENYSVTDAALISYTSFELIEIKSPLSPSVQSSDTSVYIIEEFQ